jgi:hypothetical protein
LYRTIKVTDNTVQNEMTWKLQASDREDMDAWLDVLKRNLDMVRKGYKMEEAEREVRHMTGHAGAGAGTGAGLGAGDPVSNAVRSLEVAVESPASANATAVRDVVSAALAGKEKWELSALAGETAVVTAIPPQAQQPPSKRRRSHWQRGVETTGSEVMTTLSKRGHLIIEAEKVRFRELSFSLLLCVTSARNVF